MRTSLPLPDFKNPNFENNWILKCIADEKNVIDVMGLDGLDGYRFTHSDVGYNLQ